MCLKKSIAEREAEAVKVGSCLVSKTTGSGQAYRLRHGDVPAGYEVNCKCRTKGCILDEHHYIRHRTKTAKDYEKEAVKVGKCLVHPNSKAERHVYELRHGELSPDVCVCHKCDVRACIRDEHHFIGSQDDNVKDMVRKGRNRTGEWTPAMRAAKAEASRKMWADPKFHKAQKKRIKDGYAKKVWTKEELAAKSAAVKRGWETTTKRARNVRK